MLLLAHLSVIVGFIKHPRFSTVLSEMNYRDRQPRKIDNLPVKVVTWH